MLISTADGKPNPPDPRDKDGLISRRQPGPLREFDPTLSRLAAATLGDVRKLTKAVELKLETLT